MKYILVLILCLVVIRFLNSLVRLGSEEGGRSRIRGRPEARESAPGNPIEGRDIEDAEYEILPGEEEAPPDG